MENKKKLLGQASLIATAAAVSVTGFTGAVGAEEIESTEETQNTEATVVGSTGVTITGEIPEYTRDEAKDKQSFVDDLSDSDEFLESIVENNESVTPETSEDLAAILDEKIKNHEGAIVITENGSFTDIQNGTSLVNDRLLEEVEKQGLSSAALVSGYSVSLQEIGDGTLTWVMLPYYEET